MNTLSVVIVDDEASARRKLRSLLGKFEHLEIIAEAVDGRDAQYKIESLKPELVFMDIEMPHASGLEVALNTTHINYQLVFVTAYDEFAIKAFETHAVDYLLKPISDERLRKCLGKLNRVKVQKLENLAGSFDAQTTPCQIAIRRGSAIIVINADHIGFMEAVAGFCRINLNAAGQATHKIDTLISDTALEAFQQQLPEHLFLRIHRSYLVCAQQIVSYAVEKRRVYIRLKDYPAEKLAVSRSNVATIKGRWPAL